MYWGLLEDLQSGAEYGGQGRRNWESAGLFLSINAVALHDDDLVCIALDLARGVHGPPKLIPKSSNVDVVVLEPLTLYLWTLSTVKRRLFIRG